MNQQLFLKRTSIKKKILIPFLIMILILAISMLTFSIYLIYQHMTQQLTNEYTSRSKIMNTYITNQIEKPIHQLNSFLDKPISNNQKQTIEKVLTHNSLLKPKLIWDIKKPSINTEKYATLIKGSSNTIILKNTENNTYTLTTLVKNTINTIIVEQVLTTSFLEKIHNQFKLNTALIYINKATNKTHLINSTKELDNNGLFKLFLDNLTPKSTPLWIENITIDKSPYKLIIQQLQTIPDFYTVTSAPLTVIYTTIKKLILGTMFFIFIMCCAIYFIYNIIIQKITSSIDILSEVAKKITKGDLDQQVYAKTHDEIGELSHLFNEMVLTLKESSDKLILEHTQSQIIISHIPEGLLVTDTNNNLILANKKAELMFNFSNTGNQGKFLLDFIEQKELLVLLNEAIQKNKKVNYKELHIDKPNHKTQIFALTSALVPNIKKSKSQVITIIRDITHEKELDALRDSFLTTVSHELRTPLTSIIGFIDIVKNSDIKEDQKQHLQIALDETLSLKSMIDDLLDLSRMRAGKIELFYSKINVKECLEQLVTRFTPITSNKALKIITPFKNNSMFLNADNSKLKQILGNLITNAIKFTDNGTITLDCTYNDTSVTFIIKDTGIGLIESEKELIFEKFRQVDDSSTRKYEGIGLGLSIVKQLVEMHSGSIKVESIYGKGSTFAVTLPTKKQLSKKKVSLTELPTTKKKPKKITSIKS